MLHLQQLSWDFEGQRALRHHLHNFEDFEGVSKAKHLCFIEFCRFSFEHFSFQRYLNIEWENCPTGKLRQTAKTAQGKLRKAGLQQPSPPPPPPPPPPPSPERGYSWIQTYDVLHRCWIRLQVSITRLVTWWKGVLQCISFL